MRFIFKKTKIAGLIVVKPEVRADERGTASEGYKYSEFAKAGIKDYFVQENRSVSRKGVLRGFSYQLPPYGQAKLVNCVKGRIFDAVVDMRPRSETYGKAFAIELSRENGLMLYIPDNFAHAFCALTDGAEVSYKCSREYAPGHHAGLRWDDPALRVKWPVKRPKVSAKDLAWPLLAAKK